MQDDNGGVYHKVTCDVFPETVMPEKETAQLIACPISNTATGDFTAVMAKASVCIKNTMQILRKMSGSIKESIRISEW